MKIETIEISGIASALVALRLPFGKEVRSDIGINQGIGTGILNDAPCRAWYSQQAIDIAESDIKLMQTLIKRGDEHAKVLRGILVYAKVTSPVYWWCEMETYYAGRQRLSSESTMHIDCKGLSGNELVEAKASIPMGKELAKVDYYSYQALRRMVMQRHNHRLPEWHTFVDWVKTLPFAEELILEGLNLEANAIDNA